MNFPAFRAVTFNLTLSQEFLFPRLLILYASIFLAKCMDLLWCVVWWRMNEAPLAYLSCYLTWVWTILPEKKVQCSHLLVPSLLLQELLVAWIFFSTIETSSVFGESVKVERFWTIANIYRILYSCDFEAVISSILYLRMRGNITFHFISTVFFSLLGLFVFSLSHTVEIGGVWNIILTLI